MLFPLVLSMSSFAAEQQSISKSYLYGDWHCQYEGVDTKTKMKAKIDYKINFMRTGKTSGGGSLLLSVPNFPQLEYRLTDNSAWQINGSKLTLSSTDISAVNVSHPELDKFFNLKKIIPSNISESSTVITLTKAHLKVQSDSDGRIYSCNKIASKG